MLGCLKNVIGLVVIVAICAVGYLYRDRLKRAWNDLRGAPGTEVAIQPAAPVDFAKSANDKLASIADGAPPNQIVLSSAELQAMMKKHFAGMLPGYVDSARIELDDGKVRLSARVPTNELPQLKGLGQVASFLPDTTDVAVTGQLIPLRDGQVAIGVDGITAARIPLPHKIIPEILSKIRRKSEPGLPNDAIAFPLPPGAATAYVRGDSLVMLTRGSRDPAAAAAANRR